MTNQEIEHKYLVRSEAFKALATAVYPIQQGYLCNNGENSRSVRVRRKGDRAYLTIKSATQPGHIGRFEWEKEISIKDAEALLPQCVTPYIYKERYIVPYEGLIIEVDVFHGTNEGLVMAEIELESEDQVFSTPDWLGEDVTHDHRYYNSYLSIHPYTSW